MMGTIMVVFTARDTENSGRNNNVDEFIIHGHHFKSKFLRNSSALGRNIIETTFSGSPLEK